MCVSIGEVSRGNENHRCARHVDTEGGRWSRCGRREREGGGVGYLGRVVAGLPGGNTRTILWSPREISATHSRVGPSRAVTLWLTACLFGEPTLPTLDRCYSLSLSFCSCFPLRSREKDFPNGEWISSLSPLWNVKLAGRVSIFLSSNSSDIRVPPLFDFVASLSAITSRSPYFVPTFASSSLSLSLFFFQLVYRYRWRKLALPIIDKRLLLSILILLDLCAERTERELQQRFDRRFREGLMKSIRGLPTWRGVVKRECKKARVTRAYRADIVNWYCRGEQATFLSRVSIAKRAVKLVETAKTALRLIFLPL